MKAKVSFALASLLGLSIGGAVIAKYEWRSSLGKAPDASLIKPQGAGTSVSTEFNRSTEEATTHSSLSPQPLSARSSDLAPKANENILLPGGTENVTERIALKTTNASSPDSTVAALPAAAGQPTAWDLLSADDDAERAPLTVDDQADRAYHVVDRVKYARHRQDLPALIYDTAPAILPMPTGNVALQLKVVQEGTLIADAGLRSGDIVKSINGQSFQGADTIPSIIQDNLGPRLMRVEIERDGHPLLLEIGASFRENENTELVEVAKEVTTAPANLRW